MGWPEAVVKIVQALCSLIGGALAFCAFFGWPFGTETVEVAEDTQDERTDYENWLIHHRCSVPSAPPEVIGAERFICPDCSRYWLWVPRLSAYVLKHKIIPGDE